MEYLYTRAFCRPCRLHFEYALTDAELPDDPVVPCPWCDQPATHRPLQPCNAAHFERIEAEYERLVDEAEERRVKKPAKSRQQDEDREWEEDFPSDRKRYKRSR